MEHVTQIPFRQNCTGRCDLEVQLVPQNSNEFSVHKAQLDTVWSNPTKTSIAGEVGLLLPPVSLVYLIIFYNVFSNQQHWIGGKDS